MASQADEGDAAREAGDGEAASPRRRWWTVVGFGLALTPWAFLVLASATRPDG